MTHAKALYALVAETDLTLTVDNGCESESSFHSNVTFFADADDPRIPTWEQVHAKFVELQAVEPMKHLRVERNRRLAVTDWMANKDVTLPAAWKTYRQALRDLPSTATPKIENGNLINLTWPEEPS